MKDSNRGKLWTKHSSKPASPETWRVSTTVTVCPVSVFSAWQLMDSETIRFTVMAISLPVMFFPYKDHVNVHGGVHSAEHIKLAVTPVSRVCGPEMITLVGPSARDQSS